MSMSGRKETKLNPQKASARQQASNVIAALLSPDIHTPKADSHSNFEGFATKTLPPQPAI